MSCGPCLPIGSTRGLRRKLRPTKIRNALRRRWFEYRVPRMRTREAPGGIEFLGTDYGGWLIPPQVVEPGWIVYSVGLGGDISFDLELIERTGARVRGFDAVARFVDEANAAAAPEARFAASRAAIAVADGPLRMQVSDFDWSASVSAAGLYESGTFVVAPGRTLPSLMTELGDERIDLLKLDIEGSEYEVVPTIDLRALGVKVFAVQLHHTGTVAEARALIAAVCRAGYQPVASHAEVQVTFLAEELL